MYVCMYVCIRMYVCIESHRTRALTSESFFVWSEPVQEGRKNAPVPTISQKFLYKPLKSTLYTLKAYFI